MRKLKIIAVSDNCKAGKYQFALLAPSGEAYTAESGGAWKCNNIILAPTSQVDGLPNLNQQGFSNVKRLGKVSKAILDAEWPPTAQAG